MRKAGFYWVRFENKLLVAQYNEEFEYWLLPGREEDYDPVDKPFDWVSDEPLTPPKLNT